eukprot:7580421-Pyramimonas_sp.AAC.1
MAPGNNPPRGAKDGRCCARVPRELIGRRQRDETASMRGDSEGPRMMMRDLRKAQPPTRSNALAP